MMHLQTKTGGPAGAGNQQASGSIPGREQAMKGYQTAGGYMGFVDGRYVLFVSEAEYRDYLTEEAA